MRRWPVRSLVALVLIVAVAAVGLAVYHKATCGDRFVESEQRVMVPADSVFTLVVPDRGASVGDRWTAGVDDAAIAEQIRSTLVADRLSDRLFGPTPGGGGGQRLITFRATAPGTTIITLSNCFQGCGDERTKAQSRSVSWTVTVER